MTFHEDWLHIDSQAALVGLYQRVAHLDGAVIEIGSWEGRSTCVLARACHPAVVHAVDTWAGSPTEPYQLEATRLRDVHAQFLANVDAFTDGNVEAHRMGWRDYFAAHDDPVRFAFIDAEHTYNEVAGNIRALQPLLVPGAVLCGDDVMHPPVSAAVRDTLGGLEAVAALWWWQAP